MRRIQEAELTSQAVVRPSLPLVSPIHASSKSTESFSSENAGLRLRSTAVRSSTNGDKTDTNKEATTDNIELGSRVCGLSTASDLEAGRGHAYASVGGGQSGASMHLGRTGVDEARVAARLKARNKVAAALQAATPILLEQAMLSQSTDVWCPELAE